MSRLANLHRQLAQIHNEIADELELLPSTVAESLAAPVGKGALWADEHEGSESMDRTEPENDGESSTSIERGTKLLSRLRQKKKRKKPSRTPERPSSTSASPSGS